MEIVSALIGGLVVAAVALAIEIMRQRSHHISSRESWRREAMFTVAHQFLESSFGMSGPASDARKERLGGEPLIKTQQHLDRSHKAHDSMKEAMSALRLVAPTSVVQLAERVHDASHAVVNQAMGRAEPGTAQEHQAWETNKQSLASARILLIRAVRDTFGVEGSPLKVERGMESSWVIPADG
jgi:hypothetical protein